ncbi:CBF/Mak21 family-domain-containing protein [Dichotomocladium elegans]|nr:CBF/Mak21 family-domain-containing protein [Dichotomocladium elegans]
MTASSSKKRKTTSTGNFKEDRQKIRSLEASLSDKTKLNNLVELIDLAKSRSNAQTIHAAMHSLHRLFTRWQMNGDLDRSAQAGTSEAAQKVTSWLCDQYDDYLQWLRLLLSHEEPGLQLPSLKIQMALIKTQTEYVKEQYNKYRFPDAIFKPLVYAVITNPNLSELLRKEFLEKYVNAYDDIRYHFYQRSAEIMEESLGKKAGLKTIAKNVFSIIEAIQSMPTEENEINEFWTAHSNPHAKKNAEEDKFDDAMMIGDDDDLLLGDSGLVSDNEDATEKKKTTGKKKKPSPLLNLKAHKRVFQSCWITFLRMPLTEELYKKTLLILHKRILPHLLNPTFLMDFLTDSYNVGGAVSLLAINGLFVLITEHNLDYPDFYPKLYSLLDRNVMHVKFRSRFFRLLDIFLSSPLLPAALIAAFIKRLARLSLTAPPAASVIIVPFIYNLLRRHPTLMKMIHSTNAIGKSDDPYDHNEMNPYECHALESSLWEVQTLAEHYYANVSTLAKIFSEKFLKPKYNLEDFMDHTYSTFFTTEIERKRKRDPAMAFEKPGENEWEL